MSIEHADVIVIGSGQGGVPLAVDLAREGKRVVLFERGPLGGTCINVGCTPSKAFLAAAHAAGRARGAASLGVHADVRVDFPAVMDRVRGIVASFSSGIGRRISDAGVYCVHAEAKFVAPNTVSGGNYTVEAPLVILDVGGRAVHPDIPGLAGTPFLTNENVFTLRSLPPRTVVIGGGYIGLELGQGLARCGSSVRIVHRADRILNAEEPESSAALTRQLEHDGVALSLNAETAAVSYDGKAFAVTLSDGGVLHAEALLVATGRVSNAASVDPAAGGVDLDARGFVKIDDRFRTTAPGVYAIGDCAGQPAFTHVSWEDYRRVKSILAGGDRTRNDRPLAYTTFTEPQVARVGYTLEQARAAGIDARAGTIPLEYVARAIEWDQTNGFYRMVIDKANDRIIGATLVGYEAGELIHVFIAHMMSNATRATLDASMHVHPTYAEGLPSLARSFS